ncbi:MAG: hypothetical protein KDB29_04370 [Planctomycetes bacterium]|nr:hypothetical protein [Planctomycetota bacterium]
MDHRPLSTQEAWDRHRAKARRRPVIGRFTKLLLVSVTVFLLLVIFVAPLGFG